MLKKFFTLQDSTSYRMYFVVSERKNYFTEATAYHTFLFFSASAWSILHLEAVLNALAISIDTMAQRFLRWSGSIAEIFTTSTVQNIASTVDLDFRNPNWWSLMPFVSSRWVSRLDLIILSNNLPMVFSRKISL